MGSKILAALMIMGMLSGCTTGYEHYATCGAIEEPNHCYARLGYLPQGLNMTTGRDYMPSGWTVVGGHTSSCFVVGNEIICH